MKYLLLALTLLLLLSCKKETKNTPEVVPMGSIPSIIDTLKDPRSIELFLYERDTNYYSFQLRPLTQYINEYNPRVSEIVKQYATKNKLIKTVYKADYDNNGYTDMLLIGAMLWPRDQPPGREPKNLLVLNYGGNTIKTIPVSFGNSSRYLVPEQVVKNGTPLIKAETPYKYKNGHPYATEKTTPTLLTVKDTALVEYNSNPTNYDIKKIQFASSPCYGTCSIFEIHINKNREAVFLADAYNFTHSYDGPKEEKSFKTTIETETYNKLTDLLNYLDFPKLQDRYSLMTTDIPSSTLIITYNNGKIKKIEDDGLQGTFGLIKLYTYFEELRFNQKWTETTEPEGIRINTWMKGQK